MRSFVSRIMPAAPEAAIHQVRAPWTHAYQRTADARAGWSAASEGRLALDDFHVSGAEPGPPCGAELVAIAVMPARAARLTVSTEVAIDALEARLVVRAGLGRARVRLALTVTAGGDELTAARTELVDLRAVGPDVAARPASGGALRVPIACAWTVSGPPPRVLHVAVRATWDVDCGVDGQFLMRGRATASAPVLAVVAPRASERASAPIAPIASRAPVRAPVRAVAVRAPVARLRRLG